MTTTPPKAASTNTLPPTVNPSEIALSFTKPRFSCSPQTMFSVSKSDFMAAFALQSEVTRPIAKVKPSVWSPLVATRVSCSLATSTAPPGTKPATSSRCLAMLPGSEKMP